MKVKIFTAALAVIGATISFSALAEHHEEMMAEHHEMNEGPQLRPVEAHTCSFNDGKKMGDLMRVVGKWNGWMNDQDREDYTALILSPVYAGAAEFDFVWVGVWNDAQAMGAGLDFVRANNYPLSDEFSKVASCTVSGQFASLRLTAPAEMSKRPVVQFTDCTVAKGSDIESAVNAVGAMAEYEAKSGSESAHSIWFPAFGDLNTKFDFKWLVGDADFSGFAKGWDAYANKEGWRKQRKLFNGVVSCNVSRLYSVTIARGENQQR